MLDDIRNWLGDMASGKIKDAHLALSEAQNASFLRDIESLIRERDDLLAKVRVLETSLADSLAENRVLATKLPKPEGSDGRIDEPTHEVLNLLFKVDEGLDRGSIRSHLDMTEGVVMFHLDTLKELDFIGHKRGRDASFASYSEGTSFAPRGSPEKFFIKPKGRAYIMKNG